MIKVSFKYLHYDIDNFKFLSFGLSRLLKSIQKECKSNNIQLVIIIHFCQYTKNLKNLNQIIINIIKIMRY